MLSSDHTHHSPLNHYNSLYIDPSHHSSDHTHHSPLNHYNSLYIDPSHPSSDHTHQSPQHPSHCPSPPPSSDHTHQSPSLTLTLFFDWSCCCNISCVCLAWIREATPCSRSSALNDPPHDRASSSARTNTHVTGKRKILTVETPTFWDHVVTLLPCSSKTSFFFARSQISS